MLDCGNASRASTLMSAGFPFTSKQPVVLVGAKRVVDVGDIHLTGSLQIAQKSFILKLLCKGNRMLRRPEPLHFCGKASAQRREAKILAVLMYRNDVI